MARQLIFTTTYNEADNIGTLLDQIVEVAPDADILVLDDSSPDDTFRVIEGKKRDYPQLTVLRRPSKLGIGSAHKFAMLYALRERYDYLITMDADHSHDPRSIPALLARSGQGIFVTGSRYCEGARSSLTGYRGFISRTGNLLARRLLDVPIKELTTYYRCFDVASLRDLPLRRIDADGYGYALQLVYFLIKSGVELREVPIDFAPRASGQSKLPMIQIARSAVDLARLVFDKYLGRADNLVPDHIPEQACNICGERALTLQANSAFLKCLRCGASQKIV